MTKTLGLLASNRDQKGTTIIANSNSNSWSPRKEHHALEVSELIPPALVVPSLVVQPAEC